MRWPFRSSPPTLEMVQYDHEGWTIYDESETHRRWWTADRTAVMVRFAVGNPHTSYPFAFTNQPQMAAFYEQQARDAGGVMLELAPATVAGVPAFRRALKSRGHEAAGWSRPLLRLPHPAAWIPTANSCFPRVSVYLSPLPPTF